MEKNKLIELRKRLMALATVTTIGITSVTGCAAKTNTNNTNSNNTSSLPTVTKSIEETTTPTTQVEVSKDVATADYKNHAKAVAKAMYEANKAYFDERQYTVENLEHVYYVLNDKYYNEDKTLLMDKVQVDVAFDVIRELLESQRKINDIQNLKDVEKGKISLEKYTDEFNARSHYNWTISISNFLDDNENNKDNIILFDEYSKMQLQVTEYLKNGVLPTEILEKNFIEMRQEQTGNISGYSIYKKLSHNLAVDNTAADGIGFASAAMGRAIANMNNAAHDGHFMTIPVENTTDKNKKVKTETFRVGYSYDEQILVNAYYLGDLVDTKDILKAKKLIIELVQSMYSDTMCYRYEKVTSKYYNVPATENTKTFR